MNKEKLVNHAIDKELTCFKSYDVRGEIGTSFDEAIVYKIARALSQHLNCEKVVIGFDARETSPGFAKSATQGVIDSGSDALVIGLAGVEEVYWAVTEFNASAGIEVTASHNPINFNGLKMIKAGSVPLDNAEDFIPIKRLAEKSEWNKTGSKGEVIDISNEARKKYVKKVISFIDPRCFKPLRVVVNSGNGAAGPTFKSIEKELILAGSKMCFSHILSKPDSSFPFGIPNPLIEKNQRITSKAVKKEKADLGIAFDGDFDRCFFFDENGQFVPGEYIVGLLAEIFLKKEVNGRIVHDPRILWNTQDIISSNNGISIVSKTGHNFFKEEMRKNSAVYGGEMSAHHYFRDFAFCDSGMITCLLILELLSNTTNSLGDLTKLRVRKFPSSGEKNFQVSDPDQCIARVFDKFKKDALIDETDGMSFSYEKWRFNIRKSNTEPLVRVNIESKGSRKLVNEKMQSITQLIL